MRNVGAGGGVEVQAVTVIREDRACRLKSLEGNNNDKVCRPLRVSGRRLSGAKRQVARADSSLWASLMAPQGSARVYFRTEAVSPLWQPYPMTCRNDD